MSKILEIVSSDDVGVEDKNGTFRKVVILIDEAELGASKDDEKSILIAAHRACIEQSAHQEAAISGVVQKANIDASAALAISLKKL